MRVPVETLRAAAVALTLGIVAADAGVTVSFPTCVFVVALLVSATAGVVSPATVVVVVVVVDDAGAFGSVGSNVDVAVARVVVVVPHGDSSPAATQRQSSH